MIHNTNSTEINIFDGKLIDNKLYRVLSDDDICIVNHGDSYYKSYTKEFVRSIIPYFKFTKQDIRFLEFCINELKYNYCKTGIISYELNNNKDLYIKSQEILDLSYSRIKDCIYSLIKNNIIIDFEKYKRQSIKFNEKIIPENIITDKAKIILIELH